MKSAKITSNVSHMHVSRIIFACHALSCLKNKRRDVAIVDVIIPTNLVCVLFDPAIPT